MKIILDNGKTIVVGRTQVYWAKTSEQGVTINTGIPVTIIDNKRVGIKLWTGGVNQEIDVQQLHFDLPSVMEAAREHMAGIKQCATK